MNTNTCKSVKSVTNAVGDNTQRRNEFIGDVAEKFVNEIIKPRTEQIKALANMVNAEFKIVQ